MYERSAIVLERYFDEMFGFFNKMNPKLNYQNYKEMVEELQKYQTIVSEEEEVITTFDEVAKQIQTIQKKQEALCVSDEKLEEERIKLFNDLEQEPEAIAKKLQKIESAIEQNNEKSIELRDLFIQSLTDFKEKQQERNKCSKTRRTVEANYIAFVKRASEELQLINIEDLKKMKNFISLDDTRNIEKEIVNIMINNGKNEKVGFNKDVIEHAVKVRTKIAKREAECYILAFDRFKRLLSEIDSDNLKLVKYQKTLRDISAKLAFLRAEKEYIVAFLDNERMTSINGEKIHAQMMKEACENFELDIAQIENLYDLILREVAGKSTKKAYKELYDKTYLRDIEEKEKSFEKEVNHIKINIGTVINSNYWRIEGIKHIYEVFQKEVTEKFEKDLSEFQLEESKTDFELQEDEDGIEEEKAFLGEEWYISNDELEDYDEELDEDSFEEEDDDDDEEYEEDYDYDAEDEDDYDDEYEDNYDEDDEDKDDEYEEDEDYEDEYEDDNNYDDEYEEDDEYDEYEDDYELDNEEYMKKVDEINAKKKKDKYKNNIKETSKKQKTENTKEWDIEDNDKENIKEEKSVFRKFFGDRKKK